MAIISEPTGPVKGYYTKLKEIAAAEGTDAGFGPESGVCDPSAAGFVLGTAGLSPAGGFALSRG
ncbi:MAG: hypothetical protein ABSD29_05835 [Verrucomicrobiota bacterium]